MQRPAFSIVVPTFQRRDVVCDALRAIGRITYAGDVEVIVVVDGSTDGTAAALEQVACPFPTRIIVQANAGAAQARNHGASLATGEILLFLDDDMICDPDILEQHAMTYAQGGDAVLGDIPLDSEAVPGFLSKAVGDWARERSERLAAGGALTLFDLLTGQLSIRRTVFDDIGGFDGRFTLDGSFGNEDLDLGTRLLERFSVRFNPRAISYQRYVVSPRANMKQWFQAGQADVAFARKHSERASELFDLHGFSSRLTRYVLMPLARVPLLPSALAGLATALAEGASGKVRLLDRAIVKFFFMARNVLYWSGVHSSGGVPGDNPVLVLCYHAIQDLSRDTILKPYGTPAPQFAAQLDLLKQRGARFITPDEFRAYVNGSAGVPTRAVLLTFDDCYAELTQVAHTLLRPRHVPALAFAVSGVESHTNEWDQAIGCARLDLLDDAAMIEIQGLGVEIGCHSQSHMEMPKLSAPELERETSGAARQLTERGIRTPRFFAYPYGESDTESRKAVRAAGFEAAFGLSMGLATRASDPMNLPRVEILERDLGWRFWLKTTAPSLARYFA